MNSTPSTERRRKILQTVEQAVCKDRQNTYSDAEDNFQVIAELWTAWGKARRWGVQFESRDVAMMSGLIKVARAAVNLDYLDNWIDLAGYATCGGGIAEGKKPDLVAPEPEFVPTHQDRKLPEYKVQVLREDDTHVYVRKENDPEETALSREYFQLTYEPIPEKSAKTEFVPTHYQPNKPGYKIQLLREEGSMAHVRYVEGTETTLLSDYFHGRYTPIPE